MIPLPAYDEQRVAIITGASQGIGAGLVKAYRERGYCVIATARSIGPSEDPSIVTIAGDIADPDTAQRVIEETVERFGRDQPAKSTSRALASSPGGTLPPSLAPAGIDIQRTADPRT